MSYQNPDLLEAILREKNLTSPEHFKTILDQALFTAVVGDNETLVARLIEEGADVNAVNKYGDRPLSFAQGNAPILRMLVEAGADVNFVDKDGNTPLIVALQSSFLRYDTVKILINAGADVNAVNKYGYTASSYAKEYKVYQELISAIKDGDAKEVARLITNGADVNFVDIFCETPLFSAVTQGDCGIVNILLDAGADLHFIRSNGATPLSHAMTLYRFMSQNYYQEVVELLRAKVETNSTANATTEDVNDNDNPTAATEEVETNSTATVASNKQYSILASNKIVDIIVQILPNYKNIPVFNQTAISPDAIAKSLGDNPTKEQVLKTIREAIIACCSQEPSKCDDESDVCYDQNQSINEFYADVVAQTINSGIFDA